MYDRNGEAMQCLNCLSKEARRQRVSGWDWLLAPFAVPVMCNRCLTHYYYPRLLVFWHQLHRRATDH